MLLLIFYYLQRHGITVPAVFEYCSTRMACAAISSLLIVILCGKPFIKKLYEWKVGDLAFRDHCPLLSELHRDKKETPTMGGVIILFALLTSLFLWMDWRNPFTLIFFLTTLVVGCLGAGDDYLKLRYKNNKGISGRVKMLVQILLASGITLYLLWPPCAEWLHHGDWYPPPQAKFRVVHKVEGKATPEMVTLTSQQYNGQIYMPCFKDPLLQFSGWGLLLLLFWIVFVIAGSSNAVNLTDGLDGLATGTVMMASSAFALIAFISNNIDIARYLNILYIEGSGEIAIFLAALAGAALGFLWYNGYPAQVFMGDTGAMTLGAILGVAAVLLRREFLLGIVGGVFVIETLSVMLQVGSYKLRNRRRLFLCAPLHHHFEYQGWAETKVVIRFWIIGLLCAILGVITLKFQ